MVAVVTVVEEMQWTVWWSLKAADAAARVGVIWLVVENWVWVLAKSTGGERSCGWRGVVQTETENGGRTDQSLNGDNEKEVIGQSNDGNKVGNYGNDFKKGVGIPGGYVFQSHSVEGVGLTPGLSPSSSFSTQK
ncbi:hypothetical protein LWI29_009063 [Acer saccharum]|uniref:Uncharacterized protein n=1 Tax=Acer saccharum TaxID=4024 RepID=A0AA39SK85_ACESA|nr:hypothetical protein LWI29_009063 [Acer saccharum]